MSKLMTLKSNIPKRRFDRLCIGMSHARVTPKVLVSRSVRKQVTRRPQRPRKRQERAVPAVPTATFSGVVERQKA